MKRGVPQNKSVPDGLKDHIRKAYKEIKNQKAQSIPRDFTLEEANDIILKRNVRGRKGKWQLFSNEIMNSKERVIEDNEVD